MKKNILLIICGLLFLFAVNPASAALYVQYTNQLNFQNALGGVPYVTQDFESYSSHTPLDGVEILPGLSVTSNMDTVEAWGPSSTGDMGLFAYDDHTREDGNAYYQIDLTQNYNAIGFDIDAWENTGYSGSVDILFRDASTATIELSKTSSEFIPYFFGIVSNSYIDRITWNEAPETGGIGNEETLLDNITVANATPIPGAVWLLASGALGLVGLRKKVNA